MRGRRGGCAALAALVLAAVAPSAARAGSPHVDYMLECQGCHLPDGAGSPGAVPDLRASLPVLVGTPDGRSYLVRVPGSASSPLSDAALAAVLNWMVANFAAGVEGFEPFSEQEVASQRGRPLLHVEALRERLLGSAEAAGPY
ncbi:MAG: hypothetical protein QNK04_30455 [Myxococcota bacterium]|nr:hypothetical protein [Myxococcota bacterium]